MGLITQDCAKPTLPDTQLACLSKHCLLSNKQEIILIDRQITTVPRSTRMQRHRGGNREGEGKLTCRRVQIAATCPPRDILLKDERWTLRNWRTIDLKEKLDFLLFGLWTEPKPIYESYRKEESDSGMSINPVSVTVVNNGTEWPSAEPATLT